MSVSLSTCPVSADLRRYHRDLNDEDRWQGFRASFEASLKRTLMELQPITLRYHKGFGLTEEVVDGADVISEMASFDSDEFDDALGAALNDRQSDGLDRLNVLKERAIEQLLGRLNVYDAARHAYTTPEEPDTTPDDEAFFQYQEAL